MNGIVTFLSSILAVRHLAVAWASDADESKGRQDAKVKEEIIDKKGVEYTLYQTAYQLLD